MNDTPTHMTSPSAVLSECLARLEALEVKAAFSDDAVDQLSSEVYRQQAVIERLLREVQDLRRQLDATRVAGEGGSVRDELPPHY
jgi:SlyX protein